MSAWNAQITLSPSVIGKFERSKYSVDIKHYKLYDKLNGQQSAIWHDTDEAAKFLIHNCQLNSPRINLVVEAKILTVMEFIAAVWDS